MPTDSSIANNEPKGGDLVKRHRFSTRLWHWVNVVTVVILLGSGLMIFNAHPRLYWGEFGANNDPSWLQIGARGEEGFLRVGELSVTTTGVLGRSIDQNGRVRNRAFPYYVTIPQRNSLAWARRWHLTFAWVFGIGMASYAVWSIFNGHLFRDLLPKLSELSPRHIWHDIKDHARLKFPKGAAALKYNILQKLSYIGVIFVLIPILILTGLTMSPQMNANWPWLLDIFFGRQSARSIHFIAAFLLVMFFVVHILMVILAGPFNEIRSMITGKFRLPKEKR